MSLENKIPDAGGRNSGSILSLTIGDSYAVGALGASGVFKEGAPTFDQRFKFHRDVKPDGHGHFIDHSWVSIAQKDGKELMLARVGNRTDQVLAEIENLNKAIAENNIAGFDTSKGDKIRLFHSTGKRNDIGGANAPVNWDNIDKQFQALAANPVIGRVWVLGDVPHSKDAGDTANLTLGEKIKAWRTDGKHPGLAEKVSYGGGYPPASHPHIAGDGLHLTEDGYKQYVLGPADAAFRTVAAVDNAELNPVDAPLRYRPRDARREGKGAGPAHQSRHAHGHRRYARSFFAHAHPDQDLNHHQHVTHTKGYRIRRLHHRPHAEAPPET